MKQKPFLKGKLPEVEEEILRIFRIESIDDVAAMLCQIPEEDLWNLIREILLALRAKVDQSLDENPKLRSIEYLYALVRFVEISQRFPSKTEQGELLQELTSQPLREDRQITEVVKLLQKASKNPRSREASRQLRERSRKYR